MKALTPFRRVVRSSIHGGSSVLLLVISAALVGCVNENDSSPTAVALGHVSGLDCAHCHAGESAAWQASPHAATQASVAGELAGSHSGETPASVIKGEDCVACHAPTSVLANGGMSEGQVLGFFFTTSAGKFTSNTTVSHTDQWPQVACAACHVVPQGQSLEAAGLASFDSRTDVYPDRPLERAVRAVSWESPLRRHGPPHLRRVGDQQAREDAG